jgi:hypothetical protein
LEKTFFELSKNQKPSETVPKCCTDVKIFHSWDMTKKRITERISDRRRRGMRLDL